ITLGEYFYCHNPHYLNERYCLRSSQIKLFRCFKIASGAVIRSGGWQHIKGSELRRRKRIDTGP
ncbi:hypothetical protein, partial [Legionella pneumophila]|uniref:hypothetical protein n=1 Tax=Legionella pneumophila TaxID=446 RepID=UPI001E321EEF